VIPLALALLVSGASAGTGGLTGGAWAVQTPARHAIVGEVGVWATHGPRPWSVTGEIAGTWRHRGEETYDFRTFYLRVSAVGGLALGTHATTFHLGLGPALTASLGHVSWGDRSVPARAAFLGVRARVGLDGPLSDGLSWCWWTAATTRGTALEWDAGAGLGLAW
jgi:hypothetical protein